MKSTSALSSLAAALLLAAAPVSSALAWNTLDGNAPLVIAHRGASGYLPEHTLEGYKLAIQMGANYIEPDLVMTRDGVLVARHEPIIGDSTNVASLAQFAGRKTTKTIDGVTYANQYFVEDFTLAELKTLGAKQTRAGRPTTYDGQFQVPTLDEVIALAKAQSIATGRQIGIYPELKHSTYMQGVSQSLGFSKTYFEDKLVSTLHAAYGNTGNAPVFIQSFEISNLQYLNQHTDIKLVQLVDADDVNADGSMSLVAPYDRPYDVAVKNGKLTFADMVSDVGMSFVATYADGIGPWKPYLLKTVADGVDRDGDGVITGKDRRVDGSTGVIESAHANGLFIHTWTFRNDASLLGYADPQKEIEAYLKLGVDGIFTDFPDTGVAAVAALTPVPEPESYAMLLAGLGVLGLLRRRQSR
ncbi:glycerophosphodiester phosphodiesterase [Roseateles toxinivorans]|uniref:glycerophosphodiester phosphodiesterase n=1 Tax=Roseateles toxinivorans TaxID=270368 RepID=A0A4R6QQF2_9BURK|nr:glycerophosphodiester phosphodiesterase [Roseateles toxinivorans]TDP71484.1 glycerophosphoryl diester phosphodiesterase [Roseateles toxinivorans]